MKKYLISLLLIIFVSSPSYASSCYEATIKKPAPFMGNNDEIFVLDDGTIWEVKYEYEYLYEYYPQVIMCPSKGIMLINNKKLNVQQLK